MGGYVQLCNGLRWVQRGAATALVLAAASSACGQAFNIDFGSNGPPQSTYSAISNQSGVWNQNPFESMLSNTDGDPTAVTLDFSKQSAFSEFNEAVPLVVEG